MSKPQVVSTVEAPAAIGPYSQAVIAGGMVYCSGQVALDPVTKELVKGDVEAQTHQVLKNLKAVLQAAGATFDDVVKTTIFVRDMKDFQTVNTVYAEHFGKARPARATVEVSGLPLDVSVEIDAIAVLG